MPQLKTRASQQPQQQRQVQRGRQVHHEGLLRLLELLYRLPHGLQVRTDSQLQKIGLHNQFSPTNMLKYFPDDSSLHKHSTTIEDLFNKARLHYKSNPTTRSL
ncbi:hypothetical protein H2203_006661 [Taxawa tesnikishii (nom. ined.)]|nr:hypothetical protein H2203_006661 [Dothideales sp. JES 119]